MEQTAQCIISSTASNLFLSDWWQVKHFTFSTSASAACNYMQQQWCYAFFTIKADRPITYDTLNAPWLLTNRQFQWTGNSHSQLPLAELGKLSPTIDLLRPSGTNGRAIFHCLTLSYDFDLQPQASQGQGRPSWQKSRWNSSNRRTHIRTLPNVLSTLLRGQ